MLITDDLKGGAKLIKSSHKFIAYHVELTGFSPHQLQQLQSVTITYYIIKLELRSWLFAI